MSKAIRRTLAQPHQKNTGWLSQVERRGLLEEFSWGGGFLGQVLYRVYFWNGIEPLYGQPWAESVKKATEARKVAAKRLRQIQM